MWVGSATCICFYMLVSIANIFVAHLFDVVALKYFHLGLEVEPHIGEDRVKGLVKQSPYHFFLSITTSCQPALQDRTPVQC